MNTHFKSSDYKHGKKAWEIPSDDKLEKQNTRLKQMESRAIWLTGERDEDTGYPWSRCLTNKTKDTQK